MGMTRLAILRHAPTRGDGRMAGRRDIDADCSDTKAFEGMRRRIQALFVAPPAILSSPARRCLQTAAALGLPAPPTDAALWEQDFGLWEDLPGSELPDLGPLPMPDLARHRPEGGESFDDMAARAGPVLQRISRDTLIIAHAGTVRAALSLVVGPAALSFAVAPLSLSVFHRLDQHGAAPIWSVQAVNLPPF